MALAELLRKTKVIVSVGSGGVGKTTVSAALGLAAALQGQKVLVMTIDPAHRLANALGLANLNSGEVELSPQLWKPPEVETNGQLFAMMLDHKLTFEHLVDLFAPSPQIAKRIRANRWYQQMISALAGVQDYMAVEKLYEMAQKRDYDLIVLDTPPTSNTLDFLEAPQRIMNILQMKTLQWLQGKWSDEGSRTGRLLRWGGSALMRLLGRITGQAVMEEIFRLMDDLSVLYDGFREHAESAWKLLCSPDCRFIEISGAKHLALLEALYLQQKLHEVGMQVDGFVINRMPGFFVKDGHWSLLPPRKIEADPDILSQISQWLAHTKADPKSIQQLLQQLGEHLANIRQQSENARRDVAFLKQQAIGQPWVHLVPSIPEDISDIDGLHIIARMLLDPQLVWQPTEKY